MAPSGERLEALLEFETLISDLSSRFVGLAPGEVNRGIEDALRRVCEFLSIDFAIIWQWSTSAPGVLTPTHAYMSWDGPRPTEPMTQGQYEYPWVVRDLGGWHPNTTPNTQWTRAAGVASSG
jgi:hypothetical protein